MPSRSRKRPSDATQFAKLIVDIATGEAEDAWIYPVTGKNAAAVALGKLGSARAGEARLEKFSAKERRDIACRAAPARWKNDR